MRAILLNALLLLLLSSTQLYAQVEWECGTHEIFKRQLDSDPQILIDQQNLDEFSRRFASEYESQHNRNGVNYIIPIVFHVIHTYGSDNIPKQRILDELDNINKEFQKRSADSSNVVAAFKGIHADCEIEFRLAKIDPQGNCTNGITRTFSNLTLEAGENVKSLIKWPTNMYVNVWVVGNIPGGTAAYAYLPSSGMSVNHGIVCENNWIGNVGGGPTRVMSHELGHHFNLHHTWGVTNSPGLSANCSDDDWVNDTPNCIGGFGCSLTGNTCNSLDNVQNIMDYSGCKIMFTQGQKVRMHAALNSASGSRNNLWTGPNLIATGTDDNHVAVDCLPIADFDNDLIRTCTGSPVTFLDGSWRGDPTSWTWSFPGGTPSVSNDQNPVVVYNTPGTYDVSLTAGNSAGSNTITRTQIVEVRRAAAWYSIPYSESFENILFPGGFWSIENPGGNGWETVNNVAYSGSKSIRLVNFFGNTNQPDAFITPSYNLSNVSGTTMTFKMAYGPRSTSSLEQLRVYYSTDCGRIWNLRYTKSGLALATAGVVSNAFTPSGPNQWREESVNLSSAGISGKPNVIFKFEFTPDNSNNIYIDDINIDGMVGIDDQIAAELDLNIFPNPGSEELRISLMNSQYSNAIIRLMDMTGREVARIYDGPLSTGKNEFIYNGQPSLGMYILSVDVDGYRINKKYLRQ